MWGDNPPNGLPDQGFESYSILYVERQSEILVLLMKVNFFLVSKNDQFHNEGWLGVQSKICCVRDVPRFWYFSAPPNYHMSP